MTDMAALIISKQSLRALVFFIWLLVCALGQHLLSCDNTSLVAGSGYYDKCNGNGSNECRTFAILRTNSYYSSLVNLSFYLGVNPFELAKANGFSADTEFLPQNQPLLIPIDCKCSINGGLFQALVTKTTTKGESFHGIAESLEGLTTCKAIQDKNPGVPPLNLDDKVRLLVPLRCACPSSVTRATRLLVSYPVSEGDTIPNLAIQFNTTPELIISANNRSLGGVNPAQTLVPFTSLLIPLNSQPILGLLAKPREPNLRFPTNSIPVVPPHKKKSKMWMIGVYVAITGVAVGATIAIAAAFLVIQMRKRKQSSPKAADVELQQLSLSVRTTSEKKVSFGGSDQDPLDGHQIINATPRKLLIETYTMDELRKATEDFNSSNHIEGTVYHGRLNGKNLAIKRTQPEMISKIDIGLFHDAIHHHPNIIRLLGICLNKGPDSFLVFEYAKNGSLKDWLHGGLAMKNQFIASCYCFLTWNQRLRICLDVAMALQFMHHIMIPSYVHRNVKSRNIFLDEEFHAKIGNFGMARCVEDDPEYIHPAIVSPSMDIFAYGVVLLEVLSGKAPTAKKGERSVWLFSGKIKSMLVSENADEFREWMDSALGDKYSFDGAVTLANLARVCVEEDPSLRPNAGEIVEKLSRLVEESPYGEDTVLISESSSKALVKAATTTNL